MDCVNDHRPIMRAADEAYFDALDAVSDALRAFVVCDDASLADKIKELKRAEAAADAAACAADAVMYAAVDAYCSAPRQAAASCFKLY